MMLKGTAFTLTQTFRGEWILGITLDKGSVRDAMSLHDRQKAGKAYDVDVKRHREARSLNANAYFHKLANDLAKACGIGNDEMKVYLVKRYGTLAEIDGQPIEIRLPNGARVEDYYPYALWIGSSGGVDSYILYKQTHTLNSAEFARLIDGTVQECEAIGVETLPPEELRRMYAQADQGHGDSPARQGSGL